MNSNFENFLTYLRDNSLRLTPLDLCKFIGELGSLFNHESILDPACGISEILQFCRYGKIIEGYSKNEEFIKTARDILEEGSFYNESFLEAIVERKYDLIVSQLPDVIINKCTGNIKFSEVEYLNKLLPLMNEDGTIICVVTEKFLYDDYSLEIREEILKNYSLEMIVSLKEELIPEYKMNAALLVIRNIPKKQWVYLCEYDENFKNIIHNYKNHTGEFWVDIDGMARRWDRHFHDRKYRELDKKISDKRFRTIGELASVYSGMLLMPSQEKSKAKYLIFNFDAITNGYISASYNSKFTDEGRNEFILKPGDIVINRFLNKKSNLYVYKKSDLPAFADAGSIVIRSRYNSSVAAYLFSNEEGGILEQLLKGHNKKHITSDDVMTIRIPDFGYLENNELSTEHIQSLNELERAELREKLRATLRTIEAVDGKDPDGDMKQILEYVKSIPDRLDRAENIISDTHDIVKAADGKLDNINVKLDRILGVVEGVKACQDEASKMLEGISDGMEEYEKVIKQFEDKVMNIIDEKYCIEEKKINRDDRYDEEERKLVETFKESWNKLSEESRIYLITSRIVFEDLKEYNKSRDYSPACVPLTKAFELEIKKYLFAKYKEYLNNEGRSLLENKYKMDKLPRGFYKKKDSKVEIDEDEFVLGIVPDITGISIYKKFVDEKPKRSSYIRDKENDKKTDIFENYFKLYQEYCTSKLFKGTRFETSLRDYLFLLSVGIDTIRDDYRNKVAHTEKIIIDDAIKCYEYMITGEKVLYSFISKINKSMIK